MNFKSLSTLSGLICIILMNLYVMSSIQVLDATDNEPWGPHGSALAEIAQATKKL